MMASKITGEHKNTNRGNDVAAMMISFLLPPVPFLLGVPFRVLGSLGIFQVLILNIGT